MTTPTEPDTSNIKQVLQDLTEKYESLVWYARSNPASDVKYWAQVPADIRDGAFKAQMRVEEDYPEDVTQLRTCPENWQHGFNSGALATLRFVLTAQYPFLIDDPACSDDGEPFWYGGIQDAQEEFPCLDT